jgi:hypothetical protein
LTDFNPMNTQSFSSEQLRRAATIAEEIENLKSELVALLGGSGPQLNHPPKRGMSAAGRARIAAAQRARWAKFKKTNASDTIAVKPKRKMSAAGRARIAAAARARWAKAKAAGKNSL